MPFVKVGTENSADIEIHYRDHGSGKPIILIRGYPLDGNSLGTPRAGPARARLPLHQLRPARLRPVQPTDDRLRLRHVRGRSERAAGPSRARPGSRPGWLLDGHRRGDALPRQVRLGERKQGDPARRHPTVPAPHRRQPEGRAGLGVRRHQASNRRGPLCVFRGLLRRLLQHRQAGAGTDRRGGAARELQRCRRRVPLRVVRLRRHLADGTFAGICPRSTCRRWSFTAPPTESSPSRRPPRDSGTST